VAPTLDRAGPAHSLNSVMRGSEPAVRGIDGGSGPSQLRGTATCCTKTPPCRSEPHFVWAAKITRRPKGRRDVACSMAPVLAAGLENQEGKGQASPGHSGGAPSGRTPAADRGPFSFSAPARSSWPAWRFIHCGQLSRARCPVSL
jgi:hypothetical protein